MNFYCTNCWALVQESLKTCPVCGDDIAICQAQAGYVDKLIAALSHPEPGTPVRAAWMLGERREQKAVAELIRLVRESPDTVIVEAAVEALGKIDDERAREIVSAALAHPFVRVRWRAEMAMTKLRQKKHPQ